MRTSHSPSGAVHDVADFQFSRIHYDVDFCERVIPGLYAVFYRREFQGRTETIGVYCSGGLELFRAWGYTDEEHCAYHAVSVQDGDVDGPYIGCPEVNLVEEGPDVVGITVTTLWGVHMYRLVDGGMLREISNEASNSR